MPNIHLKRFIPGRTDRWLLCRENCNVTKKEIVKQISDKIGLTQLKTKEIVQLTFDAIVDTLIEDSRIELRNFGVFQVKRRKARKARNPRTGDKVDVPPKNVVTFKPGKEMEERVRQLTRVPTPPPEPQEPVPEAPAQTTDHEPNGQDESDKSKQAARARKLT